MLAEWIEGHMLPCMYRQWFGVSCPFCGSQRAAAALLRGDIVESALLYPPLIPLLATAVLFLLQKAARLSWLAPGTRVMLIADLALMAASCLLKNLGILPE